MFFQKGYLQLYILFKQRLNVRFKVIRLTQQQSVETLNFGLMIS